MKKTVFVCAVFAQCACIVYITCAHVRNYLKDITVFEIDRSIPVPHGKTANSKYPFSKLQVGDSFFVACDERQVAGIRSTASGWARRNGVQLKVRFFADGMPPGVRVWRVA